MVGVKLGYPRLELGAVGVAPLAAVAVDNPSGLSPAVGRGPAWEWSSRRVALLLVVKDLLWLPLGGVTVERLSLHADYGQIRFGVDHSTHWGLVNWIT
jgi:hypothetical protein